MMIIPVITLVVATVGGVAASMGVRGAPPAQDLQSSVTIEQPSDDPGSFDGTAGGVEDDGSDVAVGGTDPVVEATPRPGIPEEPSSPSKTVASKTTGPPPKPKTAVVTSPPEKPPEKAPEPPPEPPPPPKATGTVSFTGDASAVWLISGGTKLSASGSVPAGTYEILADFGGPEPISAGRVTIDAGSTVNLRCASFVQKCTQ
jgi:hypothetical protein